MKIAFKPADLSGVGSYRVLFPMRELEKQFEWQCRPFARRDVTLPDGRIGRVFSAKELPLDAQIIVLQREMNLAAVDQIEAWQQEGRKVVLELDDNLAQMSPSNPAWKSSHPDPLVRAGNSKFVDLEFEKATFVANRDNLWEIAKVVDAITVSTPALADLYEQTNPHVFVLENSLDWDMWENVVPPYERDPHRLRIGYMGVSDWHQEDIEELKGILGPFMAQNPEIDFVAAGDEKVHDLLDIPEGQRISYPRTAFGQHVEMTSAMDIGLVPLKMSAFNEAKSFLKGLEYNACGIAVIASPTAAYRDYASRSEACLISKRGHDWTRHLRRLVADPAEVRTLGKRGRTFAKDQSIQSYAKIWRDIYMRIASL